MRRVERWLARGMVGTLLRRRWFVPLASVALLALLAAITFAGLRSAGLWPPEAFRPRAQVVISGPTVATSAQTRVAVLGAVRLPGTYALPPDAQVRDAVQAAGGLVANADLARVALDAPLQDGQHLYIPLVGETPPVAIGGRVNLNAASAEQLARAVGLSMTLARRVVAYRDAHGPFTAVSQLLLVPLSRATYDRIKDLLTV